MSTCSICGAVTDSEADLVVHAKSAHKTVNTSTDFETTLNPEVRNPGLVCALCGLRFATPRELAAHNLGPHPRGTEVHHSEPIPG